MPRQPTISVIIPLHHHGCVDKSLESLANQTMPRSEFEIIVVDAEHALNWEPAIAKVAEAAPDLDLRYIKIPKAGRAAERNRGVMESRADLLLFSADDFEPTPGFVEEHLKVHEKYPASNIAVIGPTVFPPEMRITHFMRWLEESGNLFGVSFMRKGAVVQPDFFYGANVSFKKEFLLKAGPFDEDLPYHAYDDFEMGQRLFGMGMKTIFAPSALVHHWDPVTLKERAKIMKESGESAAILDAKRRKTRRRQGLLGFSSGLAALLGRLKLRQFRALSIRGVYYSLVLARAFTQGYNEHVTRHR